MFAIPVLTISLLGRVDLDLSTSDPTNYQSIIKNLRLSINSAHATSTCHWEGDFLVCGSEPAPTWSGWGPSEWDDYFDNTYGGDGDGGGDGGDDGGDGDSQDTPQGDANINGLISMIALFTDLKIELNKLLLLSDVNPDFKIALGNEISKLGNMISKGNALVSALNSGTNVAILAAQGDFKLAVSASAGFLAGLATAGIITATGSALAAVIGSPAWAVAAAAGAASIAAYAVSDFVTGITPDIIDALGQITGESFYINGGSYPDPNSGLDPCDVDIFNNNPACSYNDIN